MSDLYQEYTNLLADVSAMLQAWQQTGSRLLPIGQLPGLTPETPIAGGGGVQTRPNPLRPVTPVAPAITPAVRPVSVPRPVSEVIAQGPRPVAEAPRELPREAPKMAAAWERFTKEPGDLLAQFRQEEANCRRCARWQGRSHLLFGSGSPRSRLVIIGPPPTPEEEMQDKLFIGPEGEMLDKMLQGVLGLNREDVFVLPAVMCRSKSVLGIIEVEACRPLLQKQIEIIKPRCVVMMGPEAMQILGPSAARGVWASMGSIPAMPTYHPSEIITNAAHKRPAFNHLKEVKERMGQMPLFGV